MFWWGMNFTVLDARWELKVMSFGLFRDSGVLWRSCRLDPPQDSKQPLKIIWQCLTPGLSVAVKWNARRHQRDTCDGCWFWMLLNQDRSIRSSTALQQKPRCSWFSWAFLFQKNALYWTNLSFYILSCREMFFCFFFFTGGTLHQEPTTTDLLLLVLGTLISS